MAYKKFDDADKKVDQSQFGVYDAIYTEAVRRALQGINNRVWRYRWHWFLSYAGCLCHRNDLRI